MSSGRALSQAAQLRNGQSPCDEHSQRFGPKKKKTVITANAMDNLITQSKKSCPASEEQRNISRKVSSELNFFTPSRYQYWPEGSCCIL